MNSDWLTAENLVQSDLPVCDWQLVLHYPAETEANKVVMLKAFFYISHTTHSLTHIHTQAYTLELILMSIKENISLFFLSQRLSYLTKLFLRFMFQKRKKEF